LAGAELPQPCRPQPPAGDSNTMHYGRANEAALLAPGLNTTPQKEFSRRAFTYSCLDERFARYTRFFAAAALTNAVLAELATHRARWVCVSRTTIGALISLGGLLEVINLRCARRLEVLPPSSGLDLTFVETEQAYVESVLRSWLRHSARRHNRIINELDRLLRGVATGPLPLPGSVAVRRYARVLRAVTMTSGHYPSFASCDDRIKIGAALILEARQLDQPSTTSISLLGSAASSSQSSSSSRM
jgi:hypothetical protein